jgi:MinD superfamily P-loop ATPase
MRIAIASGKGGTGKTTVATNLAWMAAHSGWSVTYADCDVEEPNGHLFLKPVVQTDEAVYKSMPQVDASLCNGCGKCVRFCQFNAIACVAGRVLIFPELCHSCGGCRLICPRDAITETAQEIGRVQSGMAGKVHFTQGCMNIGGAQSPPIVRAVKNTVATADLMIFDSPPGTSCPVVETARGSDLVLLVTDSTPFGLHDLKLALDMAKTIQLNHAVVINRAVEGRMETRQFCEQTQIPILAEIPETWSVANAYAEGKLAVESAQELRALFSNLLLRLPEYAKTRKSDSPRHA